MIPALFNWLESLTGFQLTMLYLAVCVVVCVLVHFIDQYFATAEVRAIKRKNRHAARMTASREAADSQKFPIERDEEDTQ